MSEGDDYTPQKHNPWAAFGDHANKIKQAYSAFVSGSRFKKNNIYWERKGTSFNPQNVGSLWNSKGSNWKQDDWNNTVRDILAGNPSDKMTLWKDGAKYTAYQKKGWGANYFQPDEGFKYTYDTVTEEDGTIHRTARQNLGFAKRMTDKREHKGAKNYAKAIRKQHEEYIKNNIAPPPAPEKPADAPATSTGDADTGSSASGPRKTSDMTIAAKKRKELGTPGGGSNGGGSSLGVSY